MERVEVDYTADCVIEGTTGRTVRIPLKAASFSQEWWLAFRKVAKGTPATVNPLPDRPWLVVKLDADLGTSEAVAQLDEAVALLARANEECSRSQEHLGHLDVTVRDWWAGKRDTRG